MRKEVKEMVTEEVLKSILNELFSNQFEEFFNNVSQAGYITKSGKFITLPKKEVINGYECIILAGCSKVTLIIDSDKEYVYKLPISGEVMEDEFENYPNNIECENIEFQIADQSRAVIIVPSPQPNAVKDDDGNAKSKEEIVMLLMPSIIND